MARMADKGWRLPRRERTSGISAKTSMSGRGCAIMMTHLGKGFWFIQGRAGEARPHGGQNPLTRSRPVVQPPIRKLNGPGLRFPPVDSPNPAWYGNHHVTYL